MTQPLYHAGAELKPPFSMTGYWIIQMTLRAKAYTILNAHFTTTPFPYALVHVPSIPSHALPAVRTGVAVTLKNLTPDITDCARFEDLIYNCTKWKPQYSSFAALENTDNVDRTLVFAIL